MIGLSGAASSWAVRAAVAALLAKEARTCWVAACQGSSLGGTYVAWSESDKGLLQSAFERVQDGLGAGCILGTPTTRDYPVQRHFDRMRGRVEAGNCIQDGHRAVQDPGPADHPVRGAHADGLMDQETGKTLRVSSRFSGPYDHRVRSKPLQLHTVLATIYETCPFWRAYVESLRR